MSVVTPEQLRMAASRPTKQPHPSREGVVCDCDPAVVQMPSRADRRRLPIRVLVPMVVLRHDASCNWAAWARAALGRR